MNYQTDKQSSSKTESVTYSGITYIFTFTPAVGKAELQKLSSLIQPVFECRLINYRLREC
jgi:hypothetical protein